MKLKILFKKIKFFVHYQEELIVVLLLFLINKAIKKKLICIMVDTGLMRKNEFKYTYKIFKKKYKLNVKLINASEIIY